MREERGREREGEEEGEGGSDRVREQASKHTCMEYLRNYVKHSIPCCSN